MFLSSLIPASSLFLLVEFIIIFHCELLLFFGTVFVDILYGWHVIQFFEGGIGFASASWLGVRPSSDHFKFSSWVCLSHTSSINPNWKACEDQLVITNSQGRFFFFPFSQPSVKFKTGSLAFSSAGWDVLFTPSLFSGHSPWTLTLKGSPTKSCLQVVSSVYLLFLAFQQLQKQVKGRHPHFIFEIRHFPTFTPTQQCVKREV